MVPATTQQRDEFDRIIMNKFGLMTVNNSSGDSFDLIAKYYEGFIRDFILKFSFKNGKSIFKCKVFYIDTEKFNAYSIKSEEFDSIYYIGLNYGLVEKIIKIHKDYSTAEICKFNVLRLTHSFIKWPETILQIDVVLSFIIFHELGHILLGHCELNEEKIVSGTENSKEYFYLCQAKEYLADLFATVMSFSIMCSEENNKDIFFLSKNYCEACYEFWKIIKYYDGLFSDYVGKFADHPHAAVRMLYLKDCIEAEMKFHGLRDKEIIKAYSSYCKFLLESDDQVIIASDEKCLIEDHLDEIFKLFQAYSYYDFPDYKTMSKGIMKSIHGCFVF